MKGKALTRAELEQLMSGAYIKHEIDPETGVRHHYVEPTAADVLAKYDAWFAAREALGQREEEGEYIYADEFTSLDDRGTDLADELADALRKLLEAQS